MFPVATAATENKKSPLSRDGTEVTRYSWEG